MLHLIFGLRFVKGISSCACTSKLSSTKGALLLQNSTTEFLSHPIEQLIDHLLELLWSEHDGLVLRVKLDIAHHRSYRIFRQQLTDGHGGSTVER